MSIIYKGLLNKIPVSKLTIIFINMDAESEDSNNCNLPMNSLHAKQKQLFSLK